MISAPKYKICRRLGPGVYEKCQTQKFVISEGKRAPAKRGRGPKGGSEYSQQLLEKQKIRFTYGLTEKQFRNYVDKAIESKAGATDRLFELLESRLDNVVYRMGLAHTRRLARQMTSHGHFTVNGKKSTIPSQAIKIGDLVGIREGSKKSKLFENLEARLKEYTAPNWVTYNKDKGEGSVQGKPKNLDSYLDFNAVLEFYSR